jgi:hypothetical protein
LKYLLSKYARRDASTKFGPGKVLFPFFTAGWITLMKVLRRGKAGKFHEEELVMNLGNDHPN